MFQELLNTQERGSVRSCWPVLCVYAWPRGSRLARDADKVADCWVF